MIHGVLNVYKEKGYTSHDVVAKLRRITGQKKIGHTGTLDPDAEGVLPVCLGKATKLCDMLTDKDKCYEAVLLLGVETDTQDSTGRVLKTGDTDGLTEEAVREAVKSFQGSYEQVPPMYSALKVQGKKLYELAREGKSVERKARKVEIYKIDMLDIRLPRVRMRVYCSKGTYIRTLCHDIGRKLGCGGLMESLIRTKAGAFGIKESITLKEIEKRMNDGEMAEIVIPIDQMFPGVKKMAVKENWEKAARNANELPKECAEWGEDPENLEDIRVYDSRGNFIGIYRYSEEQKKFTIVKMFYAGEGD